MEMWYNLKQVTVSEDRLSTIGHKFYCTIRANHYVNRGTWYFEAKIVDLPEGAATRIGWAQKNANLQVILLLIMSAVEKLEYFSVTKLSEKTYFIIFLNLIVSPWFWQIWILVSISKRHQVSWKHWKTLQRWIWRGRLFGMSYTPSRSWKIWLST